MSDQNAYPSYQVHVDQSNNETNLVDPRYLPLDYSKYVSVVSASIPHTMYNCVEQYLLFQYALIGAPLVPKYFRFNVPNGTYSATDIVALCKYAGALDGGSINFSLEYDPYTAKLKCFQRPVSQFAYFYFVPSPFAATLGFNSTTLDPAFGVSFFPIFDYTYTGMENRYFQNASFTGTIAGTTLTISALTSGTIVLGASVSGSGVNTTTKIVAFTGFVGGLRTYSITPSQTIATQTALTSSLLTTPSTSRSDLKVSTADSVCNLTPIRNLFVYSNFQIQSQASRQVLAKIPVDVPFSQVIQYRNPNGFRGKVQLDEVLSFIQLAFYDDDGNAVDFNGGKWSVTLQFDVLRPDPEPPVLNSADEVLQPDLFVADSYKK